jgi:hypothetical protein
MTLLTKTLVHLEALPLEYSKSLVSLTGYPGSVRLMMYDSLRGKKLSDILNEKYWGAILLLEIHGSTSKIGHFISIHLDGDTVQMFDSYGLDLKTRLLTLTKSRPFLLDIVRDSKYKLVENTHHIQMMKDSSQVCGRHTCMRLRFKNLSHGQYADFIGGVRGLSADQTVTLMTMLYHSKRPAGYTGEELHTILGGWLRKRGLY